MTKTEAATLIQKQYRQKKNREEGTTIAKDILNDILDVVPNLKKGKRRTKSETRAKNK